MALDALVLAVRADVPLLIWGSPGTGKTSAVVSLGEAMASRVEVVVGSIREPTDFAGLPVVDGGEVRFAPPAWARRLVEARGGLLFLDELTTAPPAVQAAMLRIVLERRVGDLLLPADTRIIAAANPPGEAADGWDLSAPMANRFVHLDWAVTAEEVARGLTEGFPSPAELLTRPTADEHDLRWARAMVSAFLRVRPALVLDLPRSAEAVGRAWPSPRSWEMATRLLAAARAASAAPEVGGMLLRGAVGEGPGSELVAWLRHLDLPDPAGVLADPGSFVVPERGDRAHAALGAVAAFAVAADDAELWARAWQVVGVVARTAPDIAVLGARVLVGRRPAGATLPTEAP
ncbi:AAA family ATPase, partial [Nocardia jinanensis]